MVQPEQESRLPELESGVACVGIGGRYTFRFRYWQRENGKGSAKFLELPLPEDPLEVEQRLGLPDAPNFWEARAAAGEISPEHKELLESVVPLGGCAIRACTLRNHRDHVITGHRRKIARCERAASWVLLEGLNGLAIPLRPQALRLGNNGVGKAWLTIKGQEEIDVAENDVTPREWSDARNLLSGKPHVLLRPSLMGDSVCVVMHPHPASAIRADGGYGTVEQWVQPRNTQDLSGTEDRRGSQAIANGVK